MSLNKQSGNMYGFVTHTHTHLAGRCPHGCQYCSIRDLSNHRPVMDTKYSGPLRLIEKEFDVKYGSGKTIFMENCNDLFADDVPVGFIERILGHADEWPGNTYLLQTKNPLRCRHVAQHTVFRHTNVILGCTIETTDDARSVAVSPGAPPVSSRAYHMARLSEQGYRTFVTVEPIMDLDVAKMVLWIAAISPEFVAIGADSKRHHLEEPGVEKVELLISELESIGVDVRVKSNLARLRATGDQR